MPKITVVPPSLIKMFIHKIYNIAERNAKQNERNRKASKKRKLLCTDIKQQETNFCIASSPLLYAIFIFSLDTILYI